MGDLLDLVSGKRLTDFEERAKRLGVTNAEWTRELLYDDKSKLLGRTTNYALILENHPDFAGTIRRDGFADQVYIGGNALTDGHIVELKMKLERLFPCSVRTADVHDAVMSVAVRRTYHPVREYLAGLEWDGNSRIESFFSRYCGTPDDPYHQGAAVAHFLSAVKRIYEPGCKVDLMIVLESPQGWGKTTLWSVLYQHWHREITTAMDSKDFFVGLRGAWCADFGEMHQVRKADSDRVKQIITITEDSYRPPYGRCVVSYPRECVFVGGTNSEQWIRDHTGGRRFLPVRLGGRVDLNGVAAARDQLFAEAVVLMRAGVRWWDVDGAEEHQADRMEHDCWHDVVREWIYMNARNEKHLLTIDILDKALGIEPAKQGRHEQLRLANIMQSLGYRSGTARIGGKPTRCYISQ